MEPLIVAEDGSSASANAIAFLLVIGLSALVVVLFRRVRRDRQVEVNEDVRVAAPAGETAARIEAVLSTIPKARVSRPSTWQYVLVTKHIPGWTAMPGLVLLAFFARVPLTLVVTVFQEADSTIVVRLQGASELSALERLREGIAASRKA